MPHNDGHVHSSFRHPSATRAPGSSLTREDRSRSPCVGLCSTAFGDLVCRGCKRFVHEVNGWPGYDTQAREAIVSRLESYRVALLAHKIEIVDADLVAGELKRRQILFNSALHPACWVFELLRHTLANPPDPHSCGLKLKVPGSLPDIWQQMEGEMFELSLASYERGFAQGGRGMP